MYREGDPCYALYCGPRRDRQPRWVPAIVKSRCGTRNFNVKVTPRGPVWRRHVEQLQPRYVSEDDTDPGDWFLTDHPMELEAMKDTSQQQETRVQKPPRFRSNLPCYGPENPRRSRRTPKPRVNFE